MQRHRAGKRQSEGSCSCLMKSIEQEVVDNMEHTVHRTIRST